jgi:hypothetical protein
MTLGTVMASFVIEQFSFDRMRKLTHQEIEERCEKLQQLSMGAGRITIA